VLIGKISAEWGEKIEEISQREGGISQSAEISAKRKRESAEVPKYQPKGRENQPNSRNISQKEERISQTPEISAKESGESAKVPKYPPKGRENQPNPRNISQREERISQKEGGIS
jgi:hypothetical protein